VGDRAHVRRCALSIAVGRRLLPIRFLRISSRLILLCKIKPNLYVQEIQCETVARGFIPANADRKGRRYNKIKNRC